MFVVLYDGNWQRIRHENFGIWLSAEPIEEQKLVVPNFSVRGSRFERSDRSQEGSILIAASVFLLVGVILLGSIQIGYMYYTKRELQKTADLAALTGVQSLWQGCSTAGEAAVAAAGRNFSGVNATYTCSIWSKDGRPVPETDNALNLTVTMRVSPIVPFVNANGLISATAQAVTSPVAAFSVGSRLLSVNSQGLLADILRQAGLSVSSLDVLDSDGLANVDITPSGLLAALGLPASIVSGVGTTEELTKLSNLTLGQVLDATATVVGQSSVAATEVNAVKNVINLITDLPALDSLPVKLFGDGGVLTLPVGIDPVAALNAQLNALNLVAASVIVANGTNFMALGADLPLGVKVQAQVLSPPSLAVGGIRTTAVSSQVELALTIDDTKLPLKGVGLLLGVLANIHIPLTINIANSGGRLEGLCEPPLTNDQALISIGTSTISLSTVGTEITVLGGLLTASSTANYESSPISYTSAPEKFIVGEPRTIPSSQSIDVAGLTGNFLTNVLNNLQVKVLGLNLQTLTSALGGAIQPVLSSVLGPVLGSVLPTLGLDLNQTDVLLHSVQCASPRLVQ